MDRFGSYFKKGNIVASLEKTVSKTGILNCGVPHNNRPYTIFIICERHESSTEELKSSALGR